jgi:hypothetical protein
MESGTISFVWKYSEAVRRNKGDVCVPGELAPRFPERFDVELEGVRTVPDCYVNNRWRLRGRGFGNALVEWIDKEGLREGDQVLVVLDPVARKCVLRRLT